MAPSLRRVLHARTLDVDALAGFCLERSGREAASLEEDDRFFLAEWAIAHLREDPETETLAVICRAYNCLPHTYLRGAGVLDFEIDATVTLALKRGGETEEPVETRETDPWTPGDEDA